MARFDGGWVKIYRKAILGDIGANYTRSGLFQTLIVIANIQSSTAVWKGKPRKINRGEMVTSLSELAELGECDSRTVNRHLNYLVLRGTIDVEKSNFGTFIKILNYERYQGVDAEGSVQAPHDMLDGMPHGLRATGIHNEERKKERKKELHLSDEERELVKTITNRIYELTGDSSFIRYASQILGRFKSDEEFALFLEEIVESSAKAKTKPQRRTYVKTSILNAIGVLNESSAS